MNINRRHLAGLLPVLGLVTIGMLARISHTGE